MGIDLELASPDHRVSCRLWWLGGNRSRWYKPLLKPKTQADSDGSTVFSILPRYSSATSRGYSSATSRGPARGPIGFKDSSCISSSRREIVCGLPSSISRTSRRHMEKGEEKGQKTHNAFFIYQWRQKLRKSQGWSLQHNLSKSWLLK